MGIELLIGGSALLGAGASMFAGKQQANAADRSSAMQLEAARVGSRTQMRMFNLARRDLAPWRNTGKKALGQLSRMFIEGKGMQAFKKTPGYRFRMREGTRALDRSASARGRLMSGGHERELLRYGQGLASEEFGNYANRLASLAGIGQSATSQTAALGQQTGANMAALGLQGAQGAGNAMFNAGTARASGYVGAANAFTGAGNNAMFLYGAQQGWFK